jgi:DNA-directed RNA polymerase specialized sigma24 family protein
MTLVEVAEVLGCDPKTVWYYEQKALAKLREAIKRERDLLAIAEEVRCGR